MARVAAGWLLVPALFAAAGALVWHDLTSSNRPHELEGTPVVVLLLALSVVASFRLVARTRSAREQDAAPAARIAHPTALALAVVSVLLLLASLVVLGSFLSDRR